MAAVPRFFVDESVLRRELGTDPMGMELSDMYVLLKPESEWRAESKSVIEEDPPTAGASARNRVRVVPADRHARR